MSTLVPIIGKAAATIGVQVAKKGVEYASKAYSGHTGIAVLNGIVNGSKKSGENVAGKIGGMVGSILGKAAAGHAVPIISSQVKAIGETLQNAGDQIIDIATQKDEGKDISLSGAMAKLYASQVAMDTTIEAVQIHGGNGYVAEYHVERMMRDAKITQIYEGTSEIQKIVISRSIAKK